VTIQLEVGSPTSFALITTNNCSSYYNISPAVIQIPAQAVAVNYTVTYSGTTVPQDCYQTFKISSITTSNYYMQNEVVYYSASVSRDISALVPPMILQLTTVPQTSSDVGRSIISTSSSSTTVQIISPKVYGLSFTRIGANSAGFSVTTSSEGIVYYTVVSAGTPSSLVTTTAIYNNSVSSAITYGYGSAVK